ncbi:MAG: NAD(P)/FAD-dependent oxidoreductase [Anaerolineae bacterium]
MNSEPAVHQVVLIGAGFTGLAVAKGLAGKRCRVTVIDKRNFHLFQPLLYQVATGGLSPAHIATPIRAKLKKARNETVLLGEVVDVDVAARRVKLASGVEVAYDTLVIAPGLQTQYFGHPEWEPLAPGLKSIEDALTIRSHVLAAFERAEVEDSPAARERDLTFVLVGGGPTGVEMAGAIAEIAHYTLRGEFRRIDPSSANILLIESGPHILPMYAPVLRERAVQDLSGMGVSVRTDTRVTSITPEGVQLTKGDHTEFVPASVVVWAAGIKAAPWTASLAEQAGLETDRLGRFVVGPDQSLPGHPEIFVAGDLAHSKGSDGEPLPALGSVAVQQGKYVARVIRARLEGRTPPPAFRYVDRGTMATIGRSAAIADFHFVRLTGILGWMAWLFVHLMLLVEFRNRLTVFGTWAWSYVTRNRFARLITGEEKTPLSRL